MYMRISFTFVSPSRTHCIHFKFIADIFMYNVFVTILLARLYLHNKENFIPTNVNKNEEVSVHSSVSGQIRLKCVNEVRN